MTKVNNYIDIVNSYDLISVVESYGVKLKGYKNKWGLCPIPFHVHTNNTHSFSVFQGEDRQRFKCHGNCGAYGDVIDFRNGRTPTPPKYRQAKAKPFLPQFLYESFFPLVQNVREYLIMRGLSNELIEKFKFGSAVKLVNNRPVKGKVENLLSIPTFELGTLMGIKLRVLNNPKFRYFSVTGSRSSFWGYDDVYRYVQP